MFLGYDAENWRAILLLALATVACGVAVGFGAYLLQDRPEEITCAEMEEDPSKRTWVAEEVAENLNIEGEDVYRVARIAERQMVRDCARSEKSHLPVNSDLRGGVRQRVERLLAR